MRLQKPKRSTKRERKAEKLAVIHRLCADVADAILARLVVLRMTTSLEVELIGETKKRTEELRCGNQLHALYKIHTAVMAEYPRDEQHWVSAWVSAWEWRAILRTALNTPRDPDIYRIITDDQLDAVSSATKPYATQAQNSRPPRKLSPTGRAVR